MIAFISLLFFILAFLWKFDIKTLIYFANT